MSWISILYKVYFQSHGQRRGMVLNVLHEQTQERKAVKDWGGGTCCNHSHVDFCL